MTTVYYPPLSRIVRADAIPGEFHAVEQFVQGGIDTVLGDILYKDLISDVSHDGVQQYHSLTILTKELKLPIPGTGMNLVFFHGETTNLSEFPIVLDWRWEAKKYISQIEDGGFSALPEAFIGVLLDLIDVENEREFIGQIIGTFLDDGSNKYLDYINSLISQLSNMDPGGTPALTTEINNITTQLNAILAEVDSLITSTNLYTIGSLFETYENNSTLLTAVNSAIDSLEKLEDDFDLEFDVFEELIQAAIGEFSDIDEKFDRLGTLFQSWFDGITKQDFYDLAVPQFSLTLDSINAALEFPRNWLIPTLTDASGNDILDNNGNYQEDPDINNLSALVFTLGNTTLSTKSGFDFENQPSFAFRRSFIGNTGILLEFDNLKVDFSKTSNIPEADADGRPENFTGMYAGSAAVILPSKWFTVPNVPNVPNSPNVPNAEIFAERLLVGTGGLSGEIGLRAQGNNDIFWANIGSSSGFEVGFSSFDITFKQNKVLHSNIVGALKIPKFNYPTGHLNAGDPVEIEIEGHIADDGDFYLTASADPAYPIAFGDVFTYDISSLEFGREDENFYLGTSGKLQFEGFLKNVLNLEAIEVERLRIYDTGKIEFEGGGINLVEPIVLPLGPVSITVTAIHYGSHQREYDGLQRKYNYFGFDGGISIDPLGIEVRGDGVKYYYCTDDQPDKPPAYLHIQTLYLDLTIPANSPAFIFEGWLSIPEPGTSPEYAGGIKIQVPQAKIAGSADMRLMPRYPAFIIDMEVDLPAPIPIGPVGIFALRGLVGYRYVAEKEAVGLESGVDTWFDYYKYPPRGIHVTKFNGPDKTKLSGTPLSFGVGASLGTSADNGTIINIRAMLLLSIPSLFMIDGRAAIISARLGLEETDEEPFFAFIAIGDNSLELGFGADFKMPTKSGDILELYVDAQAYFDFKNSSNWYINLGTKTAPTTAKIVKILTIKSYLMLSAKGIEAGARGDFSFKRQHGPINVSAWAYIELGGNISFERPQFGAYMAAGVGADIDVKIIRLYAAFDMLLGVEGAKPFKIYGEFRVCVEVKILFFKFEFCGNLDLVWEFNQQVDRTPLSPLLSADSTLEISKLAKGVSMLSNETFDLVYLNDTIPSNLPQSVAQNIIPLDTYIDLKTEKGLLAGAISSIIGGVTNAPERYEDLIPPKKIIRGKEVRQVTHQYSVTNFELKSWNPSTNQWVAYDPWKALNPTDTSLDGLLAGQFQKSDGQYNKIRLLATSPLSYTEQGMPGWFIPEQNGLMPGTLFCEGTYKTKKCANFVEKPRGEKYYCIDSNQLFYSNQAAFLLLDHRTGEHAEIVSRSNPFGFNQSLEFENRHRLRITLPDPSVEVDIKLSGNAKSVEVKYYASRIDDTSLQPQYRHPDTSAANPSQAHSVIVPISQFPQVISYNNPNWLPISRIEINPISTNEVLINQLLETIEQAEHHNFMIALGLKTGEIINVQPLLERLDNLHDKVCEQHDPPVKFAAKYTRPNIKIQTAKRFSEASGDYCYAVGHADRGAAILKTDLDGNVIWCREISFQTKKPIVFQDIIQLQSHYVVVGSDGNDFYLQSIHSQGVPTGQNRIHANSSEMPFLLPAKKKDSFYLIFTDLLRSGLKHPMCYSISAKGQLQASRELDFPTLANHHIIVKSARIDDESIVLALDVKARKNVKPNNPDIRVGPKRAKLKSNLKAGSPKLIYKQLEKTKKINTRSIKTKGAVTKINSLKNPRLRDFNPRQTPALLTPIIGSIICELLHTLRAKTAHFYKDLSVQDMVDFKPNDYLFTAYHNRLKKLVIVSHGTKNNNKGVIIDSVPGDRTTLAKGAEGKHFYLSHVSGQDNKLYRVGRNFIASESKSISCEGKTPLIIAMEPTVSDESLVISFNNPSILALVDEKLDLCLFKDIRTPEWEKTDFEFRRITIKSEGIEKRLAGVEMAIRPIYPNRTEICGSQFVKQPCATLLHELCWLSLQDYQYNINVPSQDAINQDTQATIQGMTENIQPIWRPDTSYVMKITLEDSVDNGNTIGSFDYVYGFSTGGPLGYFHTNDNVDYGDPNYPDQYPLTRLTRYIDFKRSYPNADGNLLGAKPLFYDSPLTKIDLFFTKAWARNFFHEWPAYNGLDAIAARLKIVIKDPVEGDEVVNPPYLDFDPADTIHTNTPQTVETWADDPDPIVPHVYQQYQNLLESQTCVLYGGQTIKPKAEYYQTIPKNLKPNKLYTVIVNNLYDLNGDGDFDVPNEMREIHKFGFKTSQYRDFIDQINSFYLQETIDGVVQTSTATYPIDKGFTAQEVSAALDCIQGTSNSLADAIETQYVHKFDRIMEGILAFDPLPHCLTTEVNVIRDSNDNGKIIGLLIRNPEPFNNPRIPLEYINPSFAVLDNSGNPLPGYSHIFSKDYSQIFVMHNSLEVTGVLNLRFEYKLYDGTDFIVPPTGTATLTGLIF